MKKYDAAMDVLDDIACDYNINEGAEGKEITPGHKRCVDMAEAFLKSVRNRQAILDS